MIDVLETNGLTMSDPILSKDKIFVTINGTRYAYTMKDDSELDPKELIKKVIGIKKYSDGRALSFLKKHCDGSKYEVASYNKVTEDSEYSKERAIRISVTDCIINCIVEILDLLNIEDNDNKELLRITQDDRISRLKRDLMKALNKVISDGSEVTEDIHDVDRTKEFNDIQRNVNKRINNTIYDLAHEYGCTDDYFPVQKVIDSAAAKRVRTDLANAIFAATR